MALTKKDLKNIENIIDNSLDIKLNKKFEDFEFKVSQKLQDMKSDFYNRVDPVLKEVTASREERKILSRKFEEYADRIDKLEGIHPKGRHTFAS